VILYTIKDVDMFVAVFRRAGDDSNSTCVQVLSPSVQ